MGNSKNPRSLRRSDDGGSFESDQRVSIAGRKIPKSIVERSPKLRQKRKGENELEWMWNTTKEDVGRAVRGVKKVFGG